MDHVLIDNTGAQPTHKDIQIIILAINIMFGQASV